MSLETATSNTFVAYKGTEFCVNLSKMNLNIKFWDTSLIFLYGINREYISSCRLVSRDYGCGRLVKLMEERISI